jgi:hypothetical protein
MTHERVTPQGQALGQISAKLVAGGKKSLSPGLANLNLPSLRDEMCKSCAGRAGTVPNGCVQTQLDFLKAVVEGEKFLCHAPLDGRMCAGAIAARAQVVSAPLPKEHVDLVALWEFSAPDEESAA